MKLGTSLTVVTTLLLSIGAAHAETMVSKDTMMTLYTYDKDTAGASTCYDDCAVNWPPYLGKAGEEKAMGEGWTLVERKDKTLQWAYDGKPVYLFIGDKKQGDMTGDGKGGVWKVLAQ